MLCSQHCYFLRHFDFLKNREIRELEIKVLRKLHVLTDYCKRKKEIINYDFRLSDYRFKITLFNGQ